MFPSLVSGNQQQTSSSGKSFISKQQLPFLRDLWQQAQGMSNAVTPGVQALGQSLIPGMQGAFNNTLGLTDPQAQIDAQSASLQAGLGQLFREEINPAITSNAIAAGGLGGGRQGVAQGVAAGQLGQAFTQGLGDITARANQQALGAANSLGGQAGAMTGAAMAGFDPLSRLAAIIGAPTVLNKQESSGSSSGFKFGF